MEEIIDGEDILPTEGAREDTEMNPTALRIIEKVVDREVVKSTKKTLQESPKDSSSTDDNVEEDFELISADELSLPEDS